MADPKKSDYQNRATALELDYVEKTTVDDLKTLIEEEMTNLGTWDGDHFNDKAAEETTDESTDGEEGEDKTEVEYTLADGETIESLLVDEDDDSIRELVEKLTIEVDVTDEENAEEWRTNAIEALLGHDENIVAEAMLVLGMMDRDYEEDQLEEVLIATKAGDLGDVCAELELVKSGNKQAKIDRILESEPDAIFDALVDLSLWPIPEEEAPAEEGTPTLKDKISDLEKEGVPAVIQLVNYFQQIDSFDEARDIIDMGIAKYPGSSVLKNRKKTLDTIITEHEAALGAYELDKRQKALEAKHAKKRSGKKEGREITEQDIIDGTNEMIIDLGKLVALKRSQGKGTTRYQAAQATLRRLIQNNYRS